MIGLSELVLPHIGFSAHGPSACGLSSSGPSAPSSSESAPLSYLNLVILCSILI